MAAGHPQTTYLKNYHPTDFVIDSIHLHVDLHEEYAEVKSILELRRNPLVNTPDAALRLDGEGLLLKKVYLDGELLSTNEYEVDDNSLTVAEVPSKFTLETVVIIKPQLNNALSGLYKSGSNFCTQCEAEGFRRITYFLDRPDVMTHFTTTISADKSKYPYLLSNGNLIETKELAGNRHWAHWEDPSLKPSYLFALVAGDFDLLTDTFTTMTNQTVDLHLYLEKGFKDQGDFALQALKNAMHWDEQTYRRAYDLDIYMIVAVSDFNMGAMENKGLNIFNTKYVLAKPETATDADYVAIEGVIGHEYFHNWTGNRITCRDWFQLTLKEGLTVFRDQTFTEDMTSAGVARIDTVNVVRASQFPEDAGPMAHPIRPQSYIEINNFYTATVYRKGAEVIRMIRTLIGGKNFHNAMDLYFERYDGQAITTEDFVRVMEEASGRDLTQFKRWYDQAGTPELTVISDYDETAKTFSLTVKQTCPPTPDNSKKLPFHLPLAVGLLCPQGEQLLMQQDQHVQASSETQILEITKSEEKFTFVNVAVKPIPSLLRGFSAPVKLHYDYSNEELLTLFKADKDYFARYEAAQLYMKKLILRLSADHLAGHSLKPDEQLIAVYKTLLQGEITDPQYVAKLICLPQYLYLLEGHPDADIEALHVAREFVKRSLAFALERDWLRLFNQYKSAQYQFNMEEVGKRALRNTALMFLTSTEKLEYFNLAFKQFERADNMTDSLGALNALNHHDCEERVNALTRFYETWKLQPLVVNKWFTLQATSLLPKTLDAVKALTQHAAYDPFNPNNVYALIVAYTTNVVRFHNSQGDSYKFIADQVLMLDRENPQVAARVLTPLTRWQQYNADCQMQIKAELERILAARQLSPDVYELVSKSLKV